MSMKEFERQQNSEETEFSSLFIQKWHHAGDFSEDELAFAQELNALFSPEAEELPPYYVPTLLDSEDQRFDPVERGFEYKTSAHVFQRLKLRRRLFYTDTSPLRVLSSAMGNSPTRRPLLVLVATFLLVMLVTVAFTGPSFASGVALLLRGTHGSGVYQVPRYPPLGMVQPPSTDEQNVSDGDKGFSLLATQQQMHFPMYFPQNIPSAYSLEHINLYVGLNQQWADGPMLEFEYSLPPSAVAYKGTGKIWVREFKPKADVLQLVKDGASVPIQMDNNGRALAIYVDGQWDMHGKNSPVWTSGQRSELVYQLNGVIFWIVGDQRDGIGEQQLMQIAQGLTPHTIDRRYSMMGDTIFVQQLNKNVPGPFSNDVIVVFPEGDDNGPYYINVGSYGPPKSVQ